MATFRCGRFPTGLVHVATSARIVDFRDGVALVDDPATAKALHAVPAVFAITEDGASGVSDRPKQRDTMPVWVDYAVQQGWDRDAAEKMKKPDLIAALTDAPPVPPTPPAEDGNGDGDAGTPDDG